MCYYKLFIFQGCGHAIPSAHPVCPCATAAAMEREHWEGRRRLAEERTRERREKGRYGKNEVSSGSPGLEMGERVDGLVCLDGVEHSTAITRQTQQEERNEDGIPTPAAIPLPGTHIARIGSGPSSPTTALPAAAKRIPSSSCETILTHPFRTLKIHASCARCTRIRAALLAQSESARPKVHVDDWRWKVKYVNPTIPEEPPRVFSSGGGGRGAGADWSQGIGEVMGSWVKEWKKPVKDALLGGMLTNPLHGPSSSTASREKLDTGTPSRLEGISFRGKTVMHGKSRSDGQAPGGAAVHVEQWKKSAKRAASEDLGNLGSRGGWA